MCRKGLYSILCFNMSQNWKLSCWYVKQNPYKNENGQKWRWCASYFCVIPSTLYFGNTKRQLSFRYSYKELFLCFCFFHIRHVNYPIKNRSCVEGFTDFCGSQNDPYLFDRVQQTFILLWISLYIVYIQSIKYCRTLYK